jgi:hypothetical protein
MSKKQFKKVQSYSNLTQTQKQILNLVSDGLNTTKKISEYRRRSLKATYKVLNKLVKYGFLRKIGTNYMLSQRVQNALAMSTQKVQNKIRYHDVKVRIKILYPKQFTQEQLIKQIRNPREIQLKNNKQIIFTINNIRCALTTKSIILSMPSILENTPIEATTELMNLLFNTIPKIEHLLNVILIKDSYMNMSIISQHCSLIENSLAKLYNKEGDKFIIKDPEDGKTRLIIDNSFKLNEFEAVHPRKAVSDMESIQPFFLGLADKSPQEVEGLLQSPKNLDLLNKAFKELVDARKEQIEVNQRFIQLSEQLTETIQNTSITQKQILYHLEALRGLNLRFDKPEYLG